MPTVLQHHGILVELGFNSDGLEMHLEENGEVELPEVVFYETFNTLDFECHRLHIEKYNLSYLKFDFNASLIADPNKCAFYRYFRGQKLFVQAIRRAFPDINITNCAGGGTRMDMGHQTAFDSVWISDNQSPIDALHIFKDTALRLPPSNMEKYDTRVFSDVFPKYGSSEKATLPLSCDEPIWNSIVTVTRGFTHASISGGVMEFSADIASYPEDEREALRALISAYKNERDFFIKANMSVLYSTRDITVIEHFDSECQRVVIHCFAVYPHTSCVTVFPTVKDGEYKDESGNAISAKDIKICGLTLQVSVKDRMVKEFYRL